MRAERLEQGVAFRNAADLLDLRYRVPDLPFGLRLTGATTTDAGVRVQLEATDTVLAPVD